MTENRCSVEWIICNPRRTRALSASVSLDRNTRIELWHRRFPQVFRRFFCAPVGRFVISGSPKVAASGLEPPEGTVSHPGALFGCLRDEFQCFWLRTKGSRGDRFYFWGQKRHSPGGWLDNFGFFAREFSHSAFLVFLRQTRGFFFQTKKNWALSLPPF